MSGLRLEIAPNGLTLKGANAESNVGLRRQVNFRLGMFFVRAGGRSACGSLRHVRCVGSGGALGERDFESLSQR